MVYRAISDKILDNLAANSKINMNYREIYAYAIEKYLSGIFNVIIFAVTAIIFQIPTEAIVFFLFYGPLRRYAGGRHAKTRTRCLVLSLLLMVSMIEISTYIASSHLWIAVALTGLFLSCLLVFQFAPIDSENKRFTETVKRNNRKKARWIVLMDSLAVTLGILFLSAFQVYLITAVMALLLEGILLIPNKILGGQEDEESERER